MANHDGDAGRLSTLLQQGEAEVARKITYDIEGVAGTVGAIPIKALATEFDSLQHERGEVLEEYRSQVAAIEAQPFALAAALIAIELKSSHGIQASPVTHSYCADPCLNRQQARDNRRECGQQAVSLRLLAPQRLQAHVFLQEVVKKPTAQ